jgi:hypothetical protein
MKNSPLIGLIVILGVLLLGLLFYINKIVKDIKQPKVDLPKEYKLINEHSLLTGHFDNDSKTLYIRFVETPDDVVEFQWDADEKDIPFEKGSHIEVIGFDRNIIYLAPIDK